MGNPLSDMAFNMINPGGDTMPSVCKTTDPCIAVPSQKSNADLACAVAAPYFVRSDIFETPAAPADSTGNKK